MIKFLKNIGWTVPFISFIAGCVCFDLLYQQKEVETPALVGKTVQETCELLSSKNLNVRILTTKEEATLQEGTIISQTPLSGQKIKQNQSVFLVISTKPKKIKAPHFVAQSLKDIEVVAQKAKINLKPYFVEGNYPEGQCFAQQPAPDAVLENNKMILYLCAPKEKTVLVPNVKNQSLDAIMSFLSSRDVKVDIVHKTQPDENHTCTDCMVVDQRPLAGSIITLDKNKPLHMQLQVYAPE